MLRPFGWYENEKRTERELQADAKQIRAWKRFEIWNVHANQRDCFISEQDVEQDSDEVGGSKYVDGESLPLRKAIHNVACNVVCEVRSLQCEVKSVEVPADRIILIISSTLFDTFARPQNPVPLLACAICFLPVLPESLLLI